MNIELLGRNALDQLRKYPNFPTTGFIAGGSLANLIWESVSGHKAIINDIDIFIFDKLITNKFEYDISNWINPTQPNQQKLYYHKKETVYFEDYCGLTSTSKSKDYYYIEKTEYNGIYNTVNYSANRKDPQIIIDSFDINCTQVGYSIDEDRFYYTDDFIYFLNTGKLQLVNLMSPGHSAIRLVKKKHDLNAHLDELELKLAQHCLVNHMEDTNRRYFTEKYAKNYRKYQAELEPYLIMKNSDEVTLLFKTQKGLDLEIFYLECKELEADHLGMIPTPMVFEDSEIYKIRNGHSLLFYIRNVQNDKRLKDIWLKLSYLYDNKDYVDADFSIDDLDMLRRLINVAPNTIKNLKGLKLSQQMSLMKTLFEKYKEDPIIAISVLEKIKIDPEIPFDEGDLLLLELSVRKEILNDTRGKVNGILYPQKKEEVVMVLPLTFNLDDL